MKDKLKKIGKDIKYNYSGKDLWGNEYEGMVHNLDIKRELVSGKAKENTEFMKNYSNCKRNFFIR